MKARKSLALLLALCMVVSMLPIASLSAVAASGTLGEGRITYYDNLVSKVDLTSLDSAGFGAPEKLFDSDLATKMEGGWPGEAGVTVAFQTTEPVTITAYTMGTNDDGSWNNRQPTGWTLSGSVDGSEWVVLDSVSDYKVYNQTEIYYDDDFRVDTPAAYSFYKMVYSTFAGGSSGHFQVAELVLSGYDYSAIVTVENTIAALPDVITADDVAAVEAARAGADALGAVSASVQNLAKLVDAEKQILVLDAEDKEKATAALDAIKAIGEVTYKSEKAIVAAEEAWNALSENDKTALASYGQILSDAKDAYQAILDGFSLTLNLNIWSKNGSVDSKWVPNQTEEEWEATKAAMVDEIKLWYYNGYNVGFTNGKTYVGNDGAVMSTWMNGAYRLELNEGPNDNVAFPMHDRTPYSMTAVPFAGMAFLVDPYVAETWDFPCPLGEPFQYNGKTYQVYMNGMKFYDTKEYANANGDGRSDSGTSITRWGFRPGSTEDETVKATIGEGYSFMYAYAQYSMAHKWEGKTVGAPDGNVAASGTKTYYQKFYGPDGDAYIITNTDLMADVLAITVDENTTSAAFQAALDGSAYVINGDMAAVIGNTNSFFEKAGDLVSVSDTEVVFANGTLTADGFTESDSAAITRVQAIVDALPAAADVQAFHKAQIEAARASFDEISETAQSGVDATKLTEAEAALKNIYDNDPAEAIELVHYIYDNLSNITYKSLAVITTAENTYAALSSEAQARVTNFARIAEARSEYQAIIDAFVWTAKADRPGANVKITKNAWVYTCSDEIWAATRAAIEDATKYQYAQGRKIDGDTTSDYDTWMTDNYGFWHIKNEQSDDNYNKQDYRNRYTMAVAPFPGIAFSVDTTFAQNWAFEGALAVGEYFKMDGKTYQVMWDDTRSYDSVEPSSSADVPATNKSAVHPEERANDTETNKNIFRYAYAKYSQDNRWDGLTLGLPQSEWAAASGNTRYQHYVGPQGNAYIFTTVDQISAAPDVTVADQDDYATKMEASYYTVTGDLAEAFANASDAERAGVGDLVSVSETEILFQYGKLNADGLVVDDADYSLVDAAIAAIPADIDNDVYTTASVQAVKDAQNAVVLGLKKIDQAIVDGYAAAINQAVANLVNRAVEMDITISTGMVTASSAMEGRYDITWNANIVIGSSTSIEDINASGIKFKSYGVYYAMEGETLADYKNASADEIRQKIFAEGDNIDIYTNFGFRLKNVVAEKTRAAMFYLEYEFDGKTFIVLSTVDEVVATIAE